MSNETLEKPMNVLLIEDDAFDEQLAKKYLKKALAHCKIRVMRDGAAALDYLHRRNEHKGETLPDMILLDMGLPKVDGTEVLRELHKDAELKNIPVVVLTGRDAEQNSIKKLHLGENCYMNKWVNMGDFLAIMKAVEDIRSARPD